jgi:hypothetical protein
MKVIIDRMEGDNAIMLVGEEAWEVIFPSALLPPGAAEGDWLELTIERDTSGRREKESELSSLLEKLKKR